MRIQGKYFRDYDCPGEGIKRVLWSLTAMDLVLYFRSKPSPDDGEMDTDFIIGLKVLGFGLTIHLSYSHYWTGTELILEGLGRKASLSIQVGGL